MDVNKELFDLSLAFLPKKMKGKVKASLADKEPVKRRSSEHDEQVRFFKALETLSLTEQGLKFAFAVPNGNKRDAITGARLKQEGVKRGVPDIVIPVPRGKYHGLFIEMKVGKNKMSDFQIEYKNYLESVGYFFACCYGCEEAIDTLMKYLELK